MDNFGDTAKGLARNPLGIIALFIVLVYALATTFAAFGTLAQQERLPIIYFLVVFPFVVLGVFAWLVAKHPRALYGPGDFRDERNWVGAMDIRVAATLAAASASTGGDGPENQAANVEAVVKTVEQFKQRSLPRKAERKCILWVDDRPENNASIRELFEELSIEVSLALSTDQALESIERQSYSAIISDMGRREGPQEGYILLGHLRASGDETPFFIYAGSASAEHRRMAAERGAQGSTNNPTELFRAVTSALLH